MLELELAVQTPVSLEVHLTARRTALVGPNGVGKTTLLRAIAGVVPSRGLIRCNGQVWQDATTHVATGKRRIGFLPQGGGLFPHMTALDNVAFGLRREHPKHRAREHADAMLHTIGAGSLRDRRARGLSGGEIQRVALARALATHPALLLLDEPLTALDAVARAEIRAVLQEHLDSGIATLLVSHDLRDLRGLAAHVAVVEEGRIVQQGTLEELAANPATPYVRALLEDR